MNLPPTEPGSSRPASPASAIPAGRYAYPGGSRPLEGYTIKRGIGHGGFGEVYYAVSDAGKEVALKLIRRNLDVELRGIKQCLNLKHPNLLAVHDIRQDERGDHWVIMEHVAGDCLDDVLSARPDGLPAEEALRWFHGIAAGVAYLHDHGIVHRDLKPGNIFSDEGRVEIGDYGLSKFISCSRRSGQTESVGTVHYMAPEIANGRYGKEIDIYALGVIFYEVLTGRVPFEGESVGEVLMKHLTAEPDLSMLAEPYRGVVARALEKDPAKRFASVAEMLAPLPRPTGSPQVSTRAIPVAAVVPVVVDAPDADALDEEPILRELRQFLFRVRDGWNNMGTVAQVVMLVLSLIALMVFGQVLIPTTLLLLMAYGGYRLVRAIVLSGRSPRRRYVPAPPGTSPPVRNHAARVAASRKERFHSRRARAQEEAADALVLGSPRERTAGLLGAMLLGAMVALTMCLVMVIVSAFRAELPRPEQIAWLALVSIVGTWSVLIPAKFWEGTRGEAMLRRFILMVVGLGVGAFAFAAAEVLMVRLTYDPDFPPPKAYELPPSFYDDGPRLLACLAVFGTLFLVIRWWRQTDPLRPTRLSLWSMIVCSAIAAVVAAVWLFPQPWLVMVACTISVSVQLASPWNNPKREAL